MDLFRSSASRARGGEGLRWNVVPVARRVACLLCPVGRSRRDRKGLRRAVQCFGWSSSNLFRSSFSLERDGKGPRRDVVSVERHVASSPCLVVLPGCDRKCLGWDAQALRRRSSDLYRGGSEGRELDSRRMTAFEGFDRITTDPGMLGGKPCIRGMRLSVHRVLEILAENPGWDDLRQDYPELEAEDIR
jgi:uncharacterized protein (DUF433 family)